MPSQKRTLQAQGVPVRDRLRGPKTQTSRRHVVQKKTPISGQMGGTQTETITTNETPTPNKSRSGGGVRQYSPIRAANKATSGVGLLEAEFIGALVLLVLLMFANTSASYGDKMMS